MKPVFGMLLVGGGVFLMIALFNGWINLSGTGTGTGLGSILPGDWGVPPQTSDPKKPGYVPPVNTKCPSGQVYNTKTGRCIPRQ